MAEAMSSLLSDHGEGTAYARIPNTDRAYFPILMCAKARTVCRFPLMRMGLITTKVVSLHESPVVAKNHSIS
jgi:hypothetical protein